jgi:hypothetical protein
MRGTRRARENSAAVDPKFAALVETLASKLEALLAMPPLGYGTLSRDMPQSGVYLFTEAGRHLYVGRSNALCGRYGRHCRPGATSTVRQPSRFS